MRINAYLDVRDDEDGKRSVHCLQCDSMLGPAEQSYKNFVAEARRPLSELGAAYQFEQIQKSRFELREYYCPSCFVLLETEVALKDDPVLHDLEVQVKSADGR